MTASVNGTPIDSYTSWEARSLPASSMTTARRPVTVEGDGSFLAGAGAGALASALTVLDDVEDLEEESDEELVSSEDVSLETLSFLIDDSDSEAFFPVIALMTLPVIDVSVSVSSFPLSFVIFLTAALILSFKLSGLPASSEGTTPCSSLSLKR